jgi:hypothetical protein
MNNSRTNARTKANTEILAFDFAQARMTLRVKSNGKLSEEQQRL